MGMGKVAARPRTRNILGSSCGAGLNRFSYAASVFLGLTSCGLRRMKWRETSRSQLVFPLERTSPLANAFTLFLILPSSRVARHVCSSFSFLYSSLFS